MATLKSKQLNLLNVPTASFDVVSGSLVPDAGNTYDLGSSQLPWRELYILSSSINFNNSSNQSVGKLAVDTEGLSLEVGLPENRVKQKIKVDLEVDTSIKDLGINPYAKIIHMARAIDAWRIFPRIFITTYIYLLYKVVIWYMNIPQPSMEQSGLVSIVVGAGAAWFGLYTGSRAKGK